MGDPSPRKPRPALSEVNIAILCALVIERDAVDEFFDQEWDFTDLGLPQHFKVGCIGGSFVVRIQQTDKGKEEAIVETGSLKNHFEAIELVLVVGVCAGEPSAARFGDTVISDRIVPYDSGKQEKNKFIPTRESVKPNTKIRELCAKLKGKKDKKEFSQSAAYHLRKGRLADEYRELMEEYRKARNPVVLKDLPEPKVFFGDVASGDIVIKCEGFRKQISERFQCRYKLIAYEMEGAGAERNYPGSVVVIKSIADHADEDKSKEWQPYATLTAAAYMGAFLDEWRKPKTGSPDKPLQRATEKLKSKLFSSNKGEQTPSPEHAHQASNPKPSRTKDDSGAQGNCKESIPRTIENQGSNEDHSSNLSKPPSDQGGHNLKKPNPAVGHTSNEPKPAEIHTSKESKFATEQTKHSPHTPGSNVEQRGKAQETVVDKKKDNPEESSQKDSPIYAFHGNPSLEQKRSNSSLPEQKGLHINTAADEEPNSCGSKMISDPTPHSPAMSTTSTIIEHSKGEVEELKSSAFSSGKPEKSTVITVEKIKSESQETQALFKACKQRDLPEVQRLLATGETDPCARNSEGQTMLHVTIGGEKVNRSPSTMQIIASIIDALCKGNTEWKADPNAKNKYGVAPIHYSVRSMNIEAARRLLAHGADVNITCNRKYTALNYMANESIPDEKFTDMLIRKHGKLGPSDLPRLKKSDHPNRWAVRAALDKVKKLQ